MVRSRSLHVRSPGERAFDRCILPSAVAVLLVLIQILVSMEEVNHALHEPTEVELAAVAPDPIWHAWIPFMLIWIPFMFGILLAIYWVWAFRGVLRSWSDPVARILRFSSLGLLLGQLFGIFKLLIAPLAGVL